MNRKTAFRVPLVAFTIRPRACPPEDVGGVWGYQELLSALAGSKRSRDDDERLEWLADFDPDEFRAAAATKAMRKGLPD